VYATAVNDADKKIFTKNWKGREEEEDPGKDGKRK
jgi:hypothetical protein